MAICQPDAVERDAGDFLREVGAFLRMLEDRGGHGTAHRVLRASGADPGGAAQLPAAAIRLT
jgi:hypothetical protein